MKEAAKVMVKMLMVMNPVTGNLVNQGLIEQEIKSKFHSTPMGTPNNTPAEFLHRTACSLMDALTRSSLDSFLP